MITTVKAKIGAMLPGKKKVPMLSVKPKIIAPTRHPGILPKPPITITRKHFMSMGVPIAG
jgi:hypothetical protein